MKVTSFNVVLAVLMLGIVVLAVFVGRDMSRPNYEFLPDMKYSPAYGAYSSNPNFENGRTMQPPVSGTIARGELPLHYSATPVDAKRAGEEFANPFAGDAKAMRRSVARGAEIYRISCTVCHGAGGLGDGPVTKRGFPPPPSMLTGKSLKMKDGQLFHILTYGQGSMAAFAGQLSPNQRWDAVNFVRSLQRPAKGAKQRESGNPDKSQLAPRKGTP